MTLGYVSRGIVQALAAHAIVSTLAAVVVVLAWHYVAARSAPAVVLARRLFLLRLAVSNLIQNAVDFSPSGAALTIEASAPAGEVELAIVDQGPGIPEFARERVFEKFFSLQRPDSGRKSTGLGLNLVKEVATLHGGSVQLDNLPERGLRARLRLPGAWTRSQNSL